METYQKFFDKFKYFKKEQNKQKQRGLNNYNILTTVLKKSDEVRLHSRMIHSLLSPNGKHYQGSLFLEKFIKQLNINNFKVNLNNCSVYKEYQQIDLYITDGHKHIIIENKVYAGDQENQIKRYIETIQNENEDLEVDELLVVYLSLDRREPSSFSLGDVYIKEGRILSSKNEEIAIFKSIQYKNEIIQWLKECKYEVQNITNLNEVFCQYIDVVNMLNNKYKDKVMSFLDFIFKDESHYKMAVESSNELIEARKTIVESFLNKVKIIIELKLGDAWIVETAELGHLSKKYKIHIKIYRKQWFKDGLYFGFEFEGNNYSEGAFGIVRVNNTVDIKNDLVPIFKTKIDKIKFDLDTTVSWLHWDYVPDYDEKDDFTALVLFRQNFENEFVEGILKMINVFEGKLNLISDMNLYLKSKNA